MTVELDLVNACLRAIGQEPVDDLDNPDVDTALAQSIIEESNEELQLTEWWFSVGIFPDDIVALENLPRQALNVVRKHSMIKMVIDLDFDANKAQAIGSNLDQLTAALQRRDLNERQTNVYNSPTVSNFMGGVANVRGWVDPLGGGDNV